MSLFDDLLADHDFAYQPAINFYGSISRKLNRAPTLYVEEGKANLVSSRVPNTNLHAPVLDIDYSAALLPSSTQGHYHLYLGVSMPWRKYKRLLKALAKAGVIERGYYRASKARKATYVRKPGVKKQPIPEGAIACNRKKNYGLF